MPRCWAQGSDVAQDFNSHVTPPRLMTSHEWLETTAVFGDPRVFCVNTCVFFLDEHDKLQRFCQQILIRIMDPTGWLTLDPTGLVQCISWQNPILMGKTM